ncbi:MAG TPA: hypothetical protein VNH53_04275 [Sphingomicrobium sp.]|nr:hypothetical protein [Sphingomicrobium sp.]
MNDSDFDNGSGESRESGESGGFRSDVRQRAIETYGEARDRVADAGRRAGDALSEAPLIALAGGLAAGALLAALLPRTRGEEQLLRPVGDKLGERARAAAEAAREAGTAKLDELGLSKDKAVETVRSMIQGVGDAARTSAQAALDAARGRD